MKLFHKYLLPAAALLLCAGLAACSEDTTDPANPYSGNFTLKTQAEVDAFPARPTANSITIEGADITDISSLDVPAVGTLLYLLRTRRQEQSRHGNTKIPLFHRSING